MNEILTKQPINQSVNHPINHSVNQSINQSTNQSFTQSTNHPIIIRNIQQLGTSIMHLTLRTKHKFSSRRLFTLLSILIVVPLGLATKYYQGPGHAWIPNHLGGLSYVVFWCLLAFLFFPQASGWKIVSIVLLITIILEFLQLIHPKFLETIRGTFVGRTIIGSSFNWIDFIFYFFGAGVGFIWIYGIKRIRK